MQSCWEYNVELLEYSLMDHITAKRKENQYALQSCCKHRSNLRDTIQMGVVEGLTGSSSLALPQAANTLLPVVCFNFEEEYGFL